MRSALVLGLLLLAMPLLPVTGSLPAGSCPVGETRSLTLPSGPAALCLAEVPVLTADARIVQQTPAGPVEVPRAGIRTLGGVVFGDPSSFVRAVEGPGGYFAGAVRTVHGWTWLEPSGAMTTQPLNPLTTPWAEADLAPVPAAAAATALRLTVRADAGFVQDRGADWFLEALTIVTVTDGAFRAQGLQGFEVGLLTGGDPPVTPALRDVDLVLAGNVPGISPLGYASLAAAYGYGPGIAWIRTSPALARPQSCYGGPYLGTLYGNVAVTMHELGHSLDLPWTRFVPTTMEQLPLHEPWYSCSGDPYAEAAPWLCTTMGGWHGEANNCMEVLAPRRPIYAASGVLAPLMRTPGLHDAQPHTHHADA